MSWRLILPFAVLIVISSAGAATAQSAPELLPPRITSTPRDGDIVVSGLLPASVSSNQFGLRINLTETALGSLKPTVDGASFAIELTPRLRAGQVVEVRYFANGGWSKWSDAVYVQPRAKSDLLYSYDPDDNPFEVAAFIGTSLDQFASSEDRAASGLGTTSGIDVNTHLHMTAGFEMGYRLSGHSHSERQVWVFSRAIYAVRSGEDLCTTVDSQAQFPCLARLAGADATEKITRIIEDAHSFETISGLRVDVRTLQAASRTPVKWYVFGQAGAVILEGAEHAKNQGFVGTGLRVPEGSFKETRVEFGPGYSQVFESKPWPRFKVHAFLGFPIAGAVRGYAEIRTDADLPHFRTISLFTVLGVHYEIGDLVKH